MHINFFHNSLFLKFPYTYFSDLNHHLQGVVEIIMHTGTQATQILHLHVITRELLLYCSSN
jgi:hypothetical protein